MGLEAPEGLEKELRAQCQVAGIPDLLVADFEPCFKATKGVWASKWGERAYYSRNAFGVPHSALTMAVLVQKVVNAQVSAW